MSPAVLRHRYNNYRSDLLQPKALSKKTEDELHKYAIEANKHQIPINKDIITKKAKELATKNGEPVKDLTWGWFIGFLDRYNLSERSASTHIPQIIPKEIQKELVNLFSTHLSIV
eukprot:TRINITY_DN4580_c2_g1_i2.p1 TRINITY_DN4580_c2_g1~~TRINITY_DN4580_c2_g1_i2.p1  ORF type:complete len:115 (+),score=3.35 TRINITY_DN4580_c2_g1_i2:204-548(+)